MKTLAWSWALFLSSTLPAQGQASELLVFPPNIQIDDGRDAQRVTVLEQMENGATKDRTASIEWHVDEPDLAEVVRSGSAVFLHGRRDGVGTLIAKLAAREVRVPLRVRNATVEPQVSFANEVVPILTRAGCNAGSCHGAAAGKNGFGLSLFGFDPAKDHRVLTHDLRGRRVDAAEPEASLILQKATTGVPHKGNQRFTRESELYAQLKSWIAAGAPNDLAKAPALQGIELFPQKAVLVGAGKGFPVQVRARFTDGSDRDVTPLVIWSSSNDGAAAVDKDGVVTARDGGEAHVLARYGGFAAVTQVLVLASDAPFTWPDVAPANFVDAAVFAKLRAAHVAPAGVCSDEVFVRRVHLDLLGILPTVAEAKTFLADTAPDKRKQLVDRLLERPEFATAQAMAWAEVLEVDARTLEQKGATLLARWLENAFQQRLPLDKVVKALLTAEGPSFVEPTTNFWLTTNQPNLAGEKVAQNFLGVRMQCAQCHNHPFESWTMNDYYGFAAFFAQVGRKRSEDPYEQIVYDQRSGEVRHKRDDSVVAPKLLGGARPQIKSGVDRRTVLADWLVAPDNPFFAKNVVNRLWAQIMGRGIVDPPDDVRVSNPASHPELLDQLAQLFVAKGFDVREVVRAICTSRTYQVARHPNDPATALFAGNRVRRLSAEQLLDAIGAVTTVPTKYPGVPLGSPATAIATGSAGVRFLGIFGRPQRESACTCDRRSEPTLSQALHLINGETIAAKVADTNGRLRRALTGKQKPEEMLEELFLAAYSRHPSEREKERLLPALVRKGDTLAAWQDTYWAVLNSKEFTFQH